MSIKLIAKLRADRDALRAAVAPLLDRMEAGEELADAEQAEIAAARADAVQLDSRIAELMTSETARLESADRDQRFDRLAGGSPEPGAAIAGPPSGRHPGPGSAFVASSELARYLACGAKGSMAPVMFSLISSIDGAAKPMAGVTPVDRDQVQPTRTTPLLDACYIEMRAADDYQWEEWPLTVPVAGDVAEGAASVEATDAYTMKFGSLGKASHWIPITREALEDNSSLRSKIEGRLMWGVRDKAEKKVAAAIVAATLPTATHADGLLQAIRVGIAETEQRGFAPSIVVINPFDAADIDIDLLARTLTGANLNAPVWGATVIRAGAVAAGTAYVGDLYSAVSVYARDQVELFATDSHAANFIEEKLVLLARQRLSAHVTQPNALVECTVAVTP